MAETYAIDKPGEYRREIKNADNTDLSDRLKGSNATVEDLLDKLETQPQGKMVITTSERSHPQPIGAGIFVSSLKEVHEVISTFGTSALKNVLKDNGVDGAELNLVFNFD
jgi:hypothetical protein